MEKAKQTNTVHLTDANFKEFIDTSKVPILVDFWAAWCGPCLMLGPIMEELASEYKDQAVVAKVNVDKNPQLASQFGISSIPAVKIFKNGKEVFAAVGAHPKPFWVNAIRNVA